MSGEGASQRPGVWWLTPVGVVVLVVPMTLTLAWRYSDEVYRQAWTTPKSLTQDTVLQLAAGALVFTVVSLLTGLVARRRNYRWPGMSIPALAVLRRAHWWLFGGTLLGYGALVLAGLSRGARPADLIARLTGAPVSADMIKAQFAPITGVTSLTQLGIAFVIVTTVLMLTTPQRGYAVRLLVVLALGLARAFLLSERLAILELVLPILALVVLGASARTTIRPALRVLPLVLVPAGVALFALFEYGRSWGFYRSRRDGSFVSFATERFAGYYATAYNNGQLLLTHGDGGGVPYLSIQGIWEAPGVAQSGLYEYLNNDGPVDWFWVLRSYGNPEFNNQCGICLPFHDYGIVGAALFFALAAVLVTLAYVSFINAHPVGVLTYPALFTGLWELPRYLYWTQGRLLPTLVVLVLIATIAGRAGSRSTTRLATAAMPLRTTPVAAQLFQGRH